MPVKMLPAFLFITGCIGQREALDRPYSNEIIGGSVERGYTGVGALLEDREPFCTATLISSTAVITAAHCLEDVRAADLSFFLGVNAAVPSTGTQVAVESIHTHPDYDADEFLNDIGVVVLKEAVKADVVPVLSVPMKEEWVGRELIFIGFGWSPEDGLGIKRSVLIPIAYLYDDAFEYSAEGLNTCQGDSGGPALYELDGQVTLVGVTSYGDPDCEEYGVNMRVDPYTDFIDPFLDSDEPTETGDDSDSDSGNAPGSDAPGEDVFNIAGHSPEGRAILSLANELDQETLDDDARLDRRAAENIIDFRAGADGALGSGDDVRIGTLEALDAIGYVGVSAFSKLLDYAMQTGLLMALWYTHDVAEYSTEADAILTLANTMSTSALDDDVRLDSRAAANIVSFRAGADGVLGSGDDVTIRFLYDLDQIGHVGASAFGRLSDYAWASGMY